MIDASRETLRRAWADRGARVALAIALVANVLIAGAYLWSRGGQTTTVVVSVAGDTSIVAVDGRWQSGRPDIRGLPPAGGIILTLEDTESVPSLPRPRGVDRVRVTDAVSGDVLFEDDFSGGPSDEWTITGRIVSRGGVTGADGPAQLSLAGRDWRDVSVEVIYANVQSAGISVRARADGYGLVTMLRPFHWNEDSSKWLSHGLGLPGTAPPGRDLYLDRSESMQSLLAMLTRPYPYALLLGVMGLIAVALLQYVPERWTREAAARLRSVEGGYIAGAAGFAVFALTFGLAVSFREHVPFVPDAVAYVFQSKIFASGALTAEPPPVEGAFDFFTPAPFVVRESSWAAQFPFAHPLVLAIGSVFGVPWLLPPMLAGASAALIFAAGRSAYATRVGALAALLLATSPFFLMNATNLMSHNTGGFFLLASLACILAWRRRPVLFGALGGVAFGLLLNTRPLTALALVLPFGAYLLWRLVPNESRADAIRHLAAFVAGGAVLASMFLGWNYVLTGDPFRTGYQATGVTFFDTPSTIVPGDEADAGAVAGLGGGGQHDSALGIQNERIQLGLLLLVLHGWPQFIGLIFALLPFLLGSRRLHDWFFLACAVATTAAWVGYERAGVMYGPRYWYEAMPFLILLAASGADRASLLLAAAIRGTRAPSAATGDAAGADAAADGGDGPLFAGRAVVYGFVLVLVLLSVNAWLLGNRPQWDADLVPNTAEAGCCILGVDDRIHRLAEEQDLENALVLVDPCNNNFVCLGSVLWRNSPSLDGNIVYAKDIPEKRQEIIAAFPGRTVYLARYFSQDDPSRASLERSP